MRRRLETGTEVRVSSLALALAGILLAAAVVQGQTEDRPARTDPQAVEMAGSATEADLRAAVDRFPPSEARFRLAEAARQAFAAGAPAGALVEVIDRARQVGLTAEDAARITERVRATVAQDLPPEPMIDRYLQGMAKGIPFARIERVAEQVQERLAEAARTFDDTVAPERIRDQVGRSARLRIIDHGGYALGAGAPPEALRAVLRLASDDETPVAEFGSPVLALGLLVSGGVPPEISVEVVQTSWEHQIRGDELERLARDIGRLGGPGAGPPPESVGRILRRIREGEDPEGIFREMERMRSPMPGGPEPPGGGPGDDPTHMHGPGGPPDDPSRPPTQGPGGPRHGPRGEPGD